MRTLTAPHNPGRDSASRIPVQLVNVPVGINEIDVLAAVVLRVPIECAADRGERFEVGKAGQVVVHPLGGRIRAPVQLMNVPVGINEIDVLAAVVLRVPIECAADRGERFVKAGEAGQVVVDPLGGRIRAPVQLMNVPVGINEIDVLAAVALRIRIECAADRGERFEAGEAGQVVVHPLGGRIRAPVDS